jgi:membrane protein
MDVKGLLTNYVWHTPLAGMAAGQRILVNALRVGHLVIRDLMKGQLNLQAMGLVYTTLLSLVPLLAVSFSVLKGFGVHNQVEPMLQNLLAPLGEKGAEVTTRIVEFVENIKVGVLGSLGLALLLYTAVSLMQKIEHAFNYTWNVTQSRSFVQRFSDYLSVILIGPVLVFSALGLTASVANYEIVQQLLEVQVVGSLIQFAGRLVPYLLVIMAFTMVYIFVPNTKVRFRSALVGGAVAGVLWQTAGWVFTTFLIGTTKYTAIYSVFASLIFFMIWLYISWLVLLVGCSIAFYFQHPEYRHLRARTATLSIRMKESIALKLITLVGKCYYNQIPHDSCTADALAKELKLGAQACGTVTEALLKADILLCTAGDSPRLVPAKAPETLTMDEVLSAVRTHEETPISNTDVTSKVEPADSLYEQYEQSILKITRDVSLHDLVHADVSTEENSTPPHRAVSESAN